MGGGAGKHVGGCVNLVGNVEDHPVDVYGPRTARAEYCSDQCRNLYRDTKQRRESGIEL
jgi:hypothetical protein